MTEGNEEPLVPVMVPRSKLGRVYALLAEPDGHAGHSAQMIDEDWSVEELLEILHDSRPSFTRMVSVLDVLCKQPAKPMAYSALAAAAGLTSGELQGAFSGFGRAMAARWGTAYSPVDRSWGATDATGQAGEQYYSVSPGVAERWKTARSM